MNAGRELDAAVAERVMGLQLQTVAKNHPFLADGTPLIAHPPAYSTEIAAAWRVLDRLTSRAYTATVFVYLIGVTCRIECAGEVITQANAATAPHAICLAALKAVGA